MTTQTILISSLKIHLQLGHVNLRWKIHLFESLCCVLKSHEISSAMTRPDLITTSSWMDTRDNAFSFSHNWKYEFNEICALPHKKWYICIVVAFCKSTHFATCCHPVFHNGGCCKSMPWKQDTIFQTNCVVPCSSFGTARIVYFLIFHI